MECDNIPYKRSPDEKLRLGLALPLEQLAHSQRSNMPISGASTSGHSTVESLKSRVASLLGSSYSAPSTLPPSVLSEDPPDDMTDITSGPLGGKGYRQRQWPNCNYHYEFSRLVGEKGCLDILKFDMKLSSAEFTQRVALKWHSTLLLPADFRPQQHKIVIDVYIPLKKRNKSSATMYIFGPWKVIEENEAAQELWQEIEHLCSPFVITRDFAKLHGDDRSFAAKVGQMNKAMADEWFPELVRRFRNAVEDQLLMSVKDEINGLLRGHLSTVWE
jgi:hypothetical protein